VLSVRNLELQDLSAIAKLHMEYLPLTFPPCRYYLNLVKLIYSYYLFCKETICWVATIDSNIVGYVCLLKYSNKLYISAFKYCPAPFCYNAIMLFIRFPNYFLKGLPRVLRTLSLSKPSKPSAATVSDLRKEHYELRPIVVRDDKQGSSIAVRLISCGENSLSNKGEKKYFLQVRKDNPRAIAFYRKMGFRTVSYADIRIVMVKDIK
jgi:ribosomal protein S18 acetylase RimI-like enzyme